VVNGKSVFFIDEVMFTKRSQETVVWAPQGTDFRPKSSNAQTFRAVAAVGAISTDGELISLYVSEDSID
jgi:hypothetical protein